MDYSDINELADEPEVAPVAEGPKGKEENLMLPPPTPTDAVPKTKKEEGASKSVFDQSLADSLEAQEEKLRKETPLAAMLPSKYEGIDVTSIFPDFTTEKESFFAPVKNYLFN